MRARLADPVACADAAQLAKTVLAAVIAWVVAVHVFHLSQAFLAPSVYTPAAGALQAARSAAESAR